MPAASPIHQALLDAAAGGDWQGCVTALAGGADPLSLDLSGHCVLTLALVHGHEDLALWALGVMASADPSLSWLEWPLPGPLSTPMHVMLSTRRHRVLAAALGMLTPTQAQCLVCALAPGTGETLIHLACRENATRALALLLKACPQARDTPSRVGLSPLGAALEADKEEASLALLDAGATLEQGACPAWACVASAAMLDALAAHVEWARARTEDGQSLLHVLARRGPSLRTPLFRAALRRFPGLVGCADRRGFAPMHAAIRANVDPALVDALVDAGARWDTPDEDGETPEAMLEEQVRAGWVVSEDTLQRWRAQSRQQAMDARLPDQQAAVSAKRL